MSTATELAIVRKVEEMELEARLLCTGLPDPMVMDKIMCYGASLERRLYQAMDQLERLQRRRKGEAVPPPLKLNVSVDGSASDASAGGIASGVAERVLDATLEEAQQDPNDSGEAEEPGRPQQGGAVVPANEGPKRT